MIYKKPSEVQLRVELIKALVRLRVHHSDWMTELEECLASVEAAGLDMPEKPKRLRLVKEQ